MWYCDALHEVCGAGMAVPPHLSIPSVPALPFCAAQGDGYLFNRGALLNAGALLLEGSSYEYYALQDVDTVPKDGSGVRYSYPRGPVPLHLTPFGIHPKANYEVLIRLGAPEPLSLLLMWTPF
jgi:hypothetical protein